MRKLRILITAVTLIFCASSQAQELFLMGITPGTLHQDFEESDKEVIKGLIILGELNGTDFKMLREFATEGVLATIDLSGVNVVKGGDPYMDDLTIQEDGVLPARIFSGCIKLKKLILPKGLKKIEDSAFEGLDLSAIEIIDPSKS